MVDDAQVSGTQEVFALRREGKLAEALEKARRLLESNPNDPWIMRSLAWCLYDEIKRLQKTGDSDLMQRAMDELGALALPEDDNLLKEKVEQILTTGPDRAACFRADELSKSGKHRAAVDVLRPLAYGREASRQIGEAYAWVLYRKLREIKDDDVRVATWCLAEFVNTWRSEWAPNSILFKCLLIQARRQAPNWAGIVPLIERMGLHRLCADDFKDDREEADYEPFQDQLLTMVYKCLKQHPDLQGERPDLGEWISSWMESFGDGEWPQYHLGRILFWINVDVDRARILLARTVQRNPEDFWRWQAFSDTLVETDAKLALSRAILCRCEDDSFKVPLYRRYAELLASVNENAAAKSSLDEAIRLRLLSGKDWQDPLPSWYADFTTDQPLDIHDFAKPFASAADELITSGIAEQFCVILRQLDKPGRFQCHCVGMGTRTLKFPNDADLPGAIRCFSAKFCDNPGGVCRVLWWKKRNPPRDVGEAIIAVVMHKNPDKRLVALSTPSHDFLPLHFAQWPEAAKLTAGVCLRLRILDLPDAKELILSWEKTEPIPVKNFLTPIAGLFEFAKNRSDFGFIQSNGARVFVPPPIAAKFKDGAQIEGWAVLSKDKHKKLSWKLVIGQSKGTPCPNPPRRHKRRYD